MATEPFVYNSPPRKVTDSELARILRLDAMAEFDAINLYAAHLDATDNEAARKILAFVIRDEKEHFTLFADLIRRLDPDQAEKLGEAEAMVDAILSLPIGASEDAVDKKTDEIKAKKSGAK